MHLAAEHLPSQPQGELDGRPDLVSAWSTYVESLGTWDWFATLTFRSEVHPESADKRYRVWCSKINRELFGNRWWKRGRGVRWIRALELQRRGVIHFHVLLGAPGLGDLRRLRWMDVWDDLAGWARIEPPRSAGAVRRYCAKYVVKGGEIDIGGALPRAASRPTWPGRGPVLNRPPGRRPRPRPFPRTQDDPQLTEDAPPAPVCLTVMRVGNQVVVSAEGAIAPPGGPQALGAAS